LRNRILKHIVLFSVGLLILSCSNTKRLAENESLLIKNKVSYSTLKPDEETIHILKNALRPKPNRKILGMRMRLRLYNAMGEPKKDNFWKFVKDNMGEQPVLYSESFSTKMEEYLERIAEENGHYQAKIIVVPITKNKKTTVEYQIKLKPAYRFGEFNFENDSSFLNKKIDSLLAESLIKKGEQYRLSTFKKERARISYELKKIGYYHFSENYLRFEVDTADGLMNVFLRIKEQVPIKSKKICRINSLTVNYDFDAKKKYEPTNQTLYDSVLINYYNKDYIPSVYTEQLFFRTSDTYNIEKQQKSIRYISSLGVFKFINLAIVEDTGIDSLLNVNLFLSSLPKRNFEAELGFSTKSSGYIGPTINLSLTNRNLLKRAINFRIKAHAGLEWQFSTHDNELENVINWGVSANLRFPKLFWPFNYDGKQGSVLPYTNLETKYNYLNYKPFVISHIINLNFAYFYANKYNTKFEIRPFNMDYYANNIIDKGFEENLENYPSLRLSLEDRFIIGGNYYLVWDSKIKNLRKHSNKQYYYKIGADLSGNLIYGFQNILGKYAGAQSEFLGLPFAQYIRLELDLRNYQKMSRNTEWAFRFLSNLGLPYKNSRELPYYKQYFIGGANGIQAFLPRKIGPGAYYEPTETSGSFILHSGEILLEVDAEYRFKIWGRIDGATFLNAGNIWLREKNEDRPLAEFEWNRFYNEIAVGTGFGLRLNYDILVIRLDWGIPLRYPYSNEGGYWIFNHNDFAFQYLINKSVLNFAIGYPF